MSAATFTALVGLCGFCGWCAWRAVTIQQAEQLRSDVRQRLVDLGWIG